MKKIYLAIIAISLSLTTKAQSNAIPNGNFESWTSGTYDTPTGYYGSNLGSFFKYNAAFNTTKTTDSKHGSFAVNLTTNVGSHGDTNIAYIVNSPNAGNGSPCQWPGGTAFNQIPTGIRGYYKSNILPGDTGGVLVAFKNGTSC